MKLADLHGAVDNPLEMLGTCDIPTASDPENIAVVYFLHLFSVENEIVFVILVSCSLFLG